LRKIKSLGFRGEALHSINSVSKLTIITKTDKEEFGWKISFANNNTTTANNLNKDT
jgi:DNA mismatch repair protein MutL